MSKISIIVPVYNSEKFLNRCLSSIVNQTYKDIEIICVNDGSKDNSLEILKTYQKNDNRIIIIDKKNAGVSAARNDAIKKSTGEYIAFVDSDDWLEKDAIETLYNTLKEKNVDVVRGNYYLNSDEDNYDTVGNLAGLENKILYTNQEDFVELVINKLLDGRLFCYVWLLLAKREYVLKTSLFKEDVLLMEDAIFYNELVNEINSIYFLDKPIYHYYINSSSCTKSNEYYVRNIYNLITANKYLLNLIDKDKFDKANRAEIINTYITNLIANYIFIMYVNSLKSKNELIKIIDELKNKEDFNKLFTSAKLNSLPIHLSIPIKLIIKRNYTLLFLFYNIRMLLRNIKQ